MNIHKLVLAGILALSCTQAQAIAFYFEHMAGFDESSFAGNVAGLNETFSNELPAGYPDTNGAAVGTGTYSDLSWAFATGGASSLKIDTFSDDGQGVPVGGTDGTSPSNHNTSDGQDVNDNGEWNEGEWWTITSLFHENVVIDGFGTPLWTMDVPSILEIYSDHAHTDDVTSRSTNTGISFNETENLANINNCDQPNHTGTSCEDFYTFDIFGFTPLPFMFDGANYIIEFGIFPIDDAHVEFLPGSVEITTAENNPGDSQVDVRIKFREVRVPEPATLALIGLGLAGLGFSSRRRKIC